MFARIFASRVANAIAVFVLFSMSLAVSVRAHAYNDYDVIGCLRGGYGGGSSALYIPVSGDQDYPPYGVYNTALDSAQSTWNGTATPVWFYWTDLGNHTIGVKDAGAGAPDGWESEGC